MAIQMSKAQIEKQKDQAKKRQIRVDNHCSKCAYEGEYQDEGCANHTERPEGCYSFATEEQKCAREKACRKYEAIRRIEKE